MSVGWKDDYQNEKSAILSIRSLFKDIFAKFRFEYSSLLSGRRSFLINAHRAVVKRCNSDPEALADVVDKII